MQSDMPPEILQHVAELNDDLINLAVLHYRSGDYGTALAVMARAVQFYKSQVGDDDPRTQAARAIHHHVHDKAWK